jgi:Ca2+-binding EF-hand superfamily protein
MRRSFAVIAAGLAAMAGLGFVAGDLAADQSGDHYRHHRGHYGMSERIHDFAERYDANKDGKISQQEIDQNRTAWHIEFDTDKDLGLTLQEFERLWLKARHVQMVREFQLFDRDGDGKVTVEEYKHPLAEIVERRDRNGDGVLSKEDRPRRGPRHQDSGHEHDDRRDGDNQGSRQNDG